MTYILVTGSAGLVGAETVRQCSSSGYIVIGVDNNMRAVFFGPEASTQWAVQQLRTGCPGYLHHEIDIRDSDSMEKLFLQYGHELTGIVHTAAQPSHDWSAKDPLMDFDVNARATLLLLELTRKYAPQATFIFTSTNKVYGDHPNHMPVVEHETRWELDLNHIYGELGFDESLSIDNCMHSPFGASKTAADILVQEFGRYFGLKTVIFRGGCLTGPGHSGAPLHGFLAYLMKCAITGTSYTVHGYGGKQVRDNIHVADLVKCFLHVLQIPPRNGEIYNIGGSRYSNCSMLEAITMCQEVTGNLMNITLSDTPRAGDHIWWITDVSKFRTHYPEWHYNFNIRQILESIYEGLMTRLENINIE